MYFDSLFDISASSFPISFTSSWSHSGTFRFHSRVFQSFSRVFQSYSRVFQSHLRVFEFFSAPGSSQGRILALDFEVLLVQYECDLSVLSELSFCQQGLSNSRGHSTPVGGGRRLLVATQPAFVYHPNPTSRHPPSFGGSFGGSKVTNGALSRVSKQYFASQKPFSRREVGPSLPSPRGGAEKVPSIPMIDF